MLLLSRLVPFTWQLIPFAAEMFYQQLANFSWLVVHHPVGSVFKGDQMASLAEIDAERGHLVADMGVLLTPENERRRLDFGGRV